MRLLIGESIVVFFYYRVAIESKYKCSAPSGVINFDERKFQFVVSGCFATAIVKGQRSIDNGPLTTCTHVNLLMAAFGFSCLAAITS